MSVHLATPDAAEFINFGAETIRILEDGSHTGHRVGLVEASLPPRSPGPPQHIYREHDETFFVLSGTVRFISGTKQLDLPAGNLLTAPRHPALIGCHLDPRLDRLAEQISEHNPPRAMGHMAAGAISRTSAR